MAAVTGGVVDQDNSTSKRQSHKITAREGYVSTVLWIVNSTSKGTPHPLKRQSHEITVREGYVSVVYHLHGRRYEITVRDVYVSVVYHLHGCRHGGRRGPGQQHK
jgi:hypothetical protein